jgi:hypothetical protein
MKKVLGAAVLAMALVGCGGPLEDDGTDATGAKKQEIDLVPGTKVGAPTVNKDLIRSPQEAVVNAPAFQTQMGLHDPIHGGCR